MTMAAGAASKILGSITSSAPSIPGSVPPAENLGLAMRFAVTIDGSRKTLGDWSSCQGLGVNFNPETLEEGGSYDTPHFFPGKITYTDITLERAITTDSWTMVGNWLREVRTQWINYDGESAPYSGDLITIRLYGSAATTLKKAILVASWRLQNAVPISWSGPTLSAKGNDFATEKLVLRHQGLLD